LAFGLFVSELELSFFIGMILMNEENEDLEEN